MPSEACSIIIISSTADPIDFVSYSQVEMFSFGCPRRLHGVSASGSRCGSRRAALELCIPSCPTAGQRGTIADNRRGDEIISKSSLSDFVRKHTCFRTPRRGRRSWIVPGRRARYLRQEFSNIAGRCTSAAATAASSNEIYTSSVISLFNRVSV